VSVGFGLPLGGISENPSSAPITTPLFHLVSRSPIPFHLSRHWVDLFSGLHLISWEEGAKGPEGKSKLVKDKSLRIKPRDASPRDPRESNKRLLSKKQEGPGKIIKQDLSQRIGGLITSQPIRSMGT
jgi:hypothetical protein